MEGYNTRCLNRHMNCQDKLSRERPSSHVLQFTARRGMKNVEGVKLAKEKVVEEEAGEVAMDQ